MNTETAEAICEWIKTHPNHVVDYYFEIAISDSAAILFKFLAEPEILIDYEDPINFRMLDDHQDADGCEHIFRRGPMIAQRCLFPKVEGTNRCRFHNHTIFSNVVTEFRGQFVFN